jgi:hypothetical protein
VLIIPSSWCSQLGVYHTPSTCNGEVLGGYPEKASARKKKQWRQQRNNKLVNSKNKGPSVYKASSRRNVGREVACGAEAAKPTNGRKIWKLLRCPCATVSVQSNHHRE